MRMTRWVAVFVMAVVLGSPLPGNSQGPIAAKDAADSCSARWNPSGVEPS